MNYQNYKNSFQRKELVARAEKLIQKHPDKRSAILDLIELCDDEVQEGESPDNEIELAHSSLNEIEREYAA